jgi:hypothetical protein
MKRGFIHQAHELACTCTFCTSYKQKALSLRENDLIYSIPYIHMCGRVCIYTAERVSVHIICFVVLQFLWIITPEQLQCGPSFHPSSQEGCIPAEIYAPTVISTLSS